MFIIIKNLLFYLYLQWMHIYEVQEVLYLLTLRNPSNLWNGIFVWQYIYHIGWMFLIAYSMCTFIRLFSFFVIMLFKICWNWTNSLWYTSWYTTWKLEYPQIRFQRKIFALFVLIRFRKRYTNKSSVILLRSNYISLFILIDILTFLW